MCSISTDRHMERNEAGGDWFGSDFAHITKLGLFYKTGNAKMFEIYCS